MQDIFTNLILALRGGGPNHPDVLRIIGDVTANHPEYAKLAQSLRDGWLVSQGQPPDNAGNLAAAPSPPAGGWLSHAGVLSLGAALAAGLYDYYLASPDSSYLRSLLARVPITTPRALLAALALLGAVGGLINAWLATTGVVLPSTFKLDGTKLMLPGFLGNVVAGAVGALVTVGMAGFPDANAAPGTTLLTPVMALSAFVAGLGGARILSGQRDKSLLWASVSAALRRPADPQAAEAVSRANSAPAVASMMATPRDPARDAAAEAEVRRLLDTQALRQYFDLLALTGQPKVLGRDIGAVRLFLLSAFRGLPPETRATLGQLPVRLVAGVSRKSLDDEAAKFGLDVTALRPQLDALHEQAQALRGRVEALPPTWRLTPEQLN